MTTGEVYNALTSGLISGVYASFGSLARLSIVQDGVTPYATMIPLGATPYAFVMNKDTFNRMPPSQQEAFMAAWDEAFWDGLLPNWEANQPLKEEIIMTSSAAVEEWRLIVPGTEEYNEFLDPCAMLLDEYAKELDASGFDSAAEIDQINGLLEKWCANWFDFERHAEPYIAASEGTLDTWLASYSLPGPLPDHSAGYYTAN